MKLYEFDHIDETLKLIPLAARRALDTIGVKLSLEGFHSLPLDKRVLLVRAGGMDQVDETAARASISQAQPPGAPTPRLNAPPTDNVPEIIISRLGEHRPVPLKVWQDLMPLDRYVLQKVTAKNRTERVSAAYDEIIGSTAISTHLRTQGGVHMVSITKKKVSHRRAIAESWITTTPDAFARLIAATAPKGDVLGTARLAGIMATKKTSDLIPLCHALALSHAEIDFEEDVARSKIRVLCTVEVEGRTGVEMEAMVGANIAALTIYDMLKSLDRGMSIGPTILLEKTGGRSGTFTSDRGAPSASVKETQ